MDATPSWSTDQSVVWVSDVTSTSQLTVAIDNTKARKLQIQICDSYRGTCSGTTTVASFDVNPVLDGTPKYNNQPIDANHTLLGVLCPCCNPDNGLDSLNTSSSGWARPSTYDGFISSEHNYDGTYGTPDYSQTTGSNYLATTCSIGVTTMKSTTGENTTYAKSATTSTSGVYCVNRVDHGTACSVNSQCMSGTCTAGTCALQPVGAVCRPNTNSDCASGVCIPTTMAGGECTGTCSGPADCNSNNVQWGTCTNGHCVTTHWTCGCTKDGDCASGQSCTTTGTHKNQCTCSTSGSQPQCPGNILDINGHNRDPGLRCSSNYCT
jgi:hypothetical protein